MDLTLNKYSIRNLVFVLVMLLVFTILFDIPLIRQSVGFIFLLFVPGYCIVYMLNLDFLGIVEKIVLSVGLSASYIMIFGYFLNQISLFLGYQTPFSTFSLLVFFSISVIIIVNLRRSKSQPISYQINLNSYDKLFIICSIFLITISILGTYIMNIWGNNELLLLLLIMTPVVFSSLLFFNCKGLCDTKTFPLVLYAISASVVFLIGLRLNYVIGDDSCNEYYFFKTTLQNLQWSILKGVTLDSCLSISILPAIYQSITKLDPQFLFKILYPTILSFCPLVVYSISKQFFDDKYSFIAGLFFVSQYGFKVTSLWCRINIAIFFFSLFIFIFVNTKIPLIKKRILIIVFLISIIISHYSTTYILLFILLSTVSVNILLSFFQHQKRNLNSSMIVLYFCFLIYWYSILTYAPFYSGTVFISRIFKSMTNIFLMDSRSGTLQKATGVGVSNIPMKLEFLYSWFVIVLIGIGALYVLYYLFETIIHKKNNNDLFVLNVKKYSIEYLVLTLSCFCILVFSVISPHVSMAYGLERIFFQLSVVTSFLFIIGGLTIGKKININPCIIMLFILVPFFLNTMGVGYQMLGSPREIVLNSDGPQYDIWFIKEMDFYGAKWLSENIYENSSITCNTNRRVLLQQFSAYYPHPFDPHYTRIGKYIFHSYNQFNFNNTTDFENTTSFLNKNFKIYSNSDNMTIFERYDM